LSRFAGFNQTNTAVGQKPQLYPVCTAKTPKSAVMG